MTESESGKSRASDLDGAGPSIPPPRTHVLRGEAAERDHVQQGGRLPRGYPMPQGIEGPPPPELAISGSNAVRGRPASTGAQRGAALGQLESESTQLELTTKPGRGDARLQQFEEPVSRGESELEEARHQEASRLAQSLWRLTSDSGGRRRRVLPTPPLVPFRENMKSTFSSYKTANRSSLFESPRSDGWQHGGQPSFKPSASKWHQYGGPPTHGNEGDRHSGTSNIHAADTEVKQRYNRIFSDFPPPPTHFYETREVEDRQCASQGQASDKEAIDAEVINRLLRERSVTANRKHGEIGRRRNKPK